MKELPNVTLVLVDTVNYGNSYFSLKNSLEQIKPARTIFFTDIDIKFEEEIEVIQIPTIHSKVEYSNFIIKELGQYIQTTHVLVTQWDSWVLNGDQWDDDWLDFDFIGAPWLYIDERNVGNGGFSLRTKRLQDILASDDNIQTCDPEDEVIGRLYREYLEQKYNCFFAGEDDADHFSFELRTPIYKTFGFHGFFHRPYQETVIIKRTGAMGDVIAVEPVLEYFHRKGYRVVLDTLPQFHNLFVQHYFKVHRPDELDQRLIPQAKTYNLDMSYESNPKQLHLKSYFEFCGVKDYKLRNPILSLNMDLQQNKLFEKYIVIHIDERPQNSRNIYGINWPAVALHLKNLGYLPIQIGMGKHETIEGAVFMNTPSEPMLMWLMAGASAFIGIDSGPANVAVALDIPVVAFYGSVNPAFLFADLTNITAIHRHREKICNAPFCWHEVRGTEGQHCYIDDIKPPCTQFKIIDLADALINVLNPVDEQDLQPR